MRIALLAAVILLAAGGCPRRPAPQQVPPPDPVLPQLPGQAGQPPLAPRGQSAGHTDEDMRTEFLNNLMASHDRLAGRLAEFRSGKPGDPGVAKVDSLLREAAARLTALKTVRIDDDFPLRLHGVNSLFFEAEQILQAAGY